MIKVGVVMAAVAAAGMLLTGMADPVVKIEVKNMHLCCGGCEGAATKAVEEGGGKEAKADKASKTLSFTAAITTPTLIIRASCIPTTQTPTRGPHSLCSIRL